MTEPTPYDTAFYTGQRQRSQRSAEQVLPFVFELISPRSVVDVGCGMGTWLKVARDLGATDILGLDGDYVLQQPLLIKREELRPTDLSQPFRVERTFDLVCSLEVAEHIPPPQAPQFVDCLTRLGSVILFSAAIPHQGGVNHFNEQWPDYWAQLFARSGYQPIDCLRDRIWMLPDIEPWYAQNVLLFASEQRLSEDAKLREQLAKAPKPLRRLVHPALYLMNAEPKVYGVRTATKMLGESVMHALKRRLGPGA